MDDKDTYVFTTETFTPLGFIKYSISFKVKSSN